MGENDPGDDPSQEADRQIKIPSIQKLGEISLSDFVKDDFIVGLDKTIKYPEDAP